MPGTVGSSSLCLPAEAAFHDIEKDANVARTPSPAITRHTDASPEKSNPPVRHELFLMCDDLATTLRDLHAKNVSVSEANEQCWGSLATLTLPSGARLGIYQPKHPKPPQPKRLTMSHTVELSS
jgi:hypothetical protein